MTTVCIAAMIIVAFTADLPSHDLFKLGRVSRNYLDHGEWWRLLSAPLLHLSVGHLVNNVLALVLIGMRLEALIGSLALISIFPVSAFSGSLGSAAFNPPNVASVGASGAIQGLLAALYVAGFTCATTNDDSRCIRSDALWFFILGMAYSSISEFTGKAFGVDLAAHVCGGIAGGLIAVALLFSRILPARQDTLSESRRRALIMCSIASLVAMNIVLLIIIRTKANIPYASIHFWGSIFVITSAIMLISLDKIATSSPAALGKPFSARRIIYTQGGTILLICGFGLIWALCMYFR